MCLEFNFILNRWRYNTRLRFWWKYKRFHNIHRRRKWRNKCKNFHVKQKYLIKYTLQKTFYNPQSDNTKYKIFKIITIISKKYLKFDKTNIFSRIIQIYENLAQNTQKFLNFEKTRSYTYITSISWKVWLFWYKF